MDDLYELKWPSKLRALELVKEVITPNYNIYQTRPDMEKVLKGELCESRIDDENWPLSILLTFALGSRRDNVDQRSMSLGQLQLVVMPNLKWSVFIASNQHNDKPDYLPTSGSRHVNESKHSSRKSNTEHVRSLQESCLGDIWQFLPPYMLDFRLASPHFSTSLFSCFECSSTLKFRTKLTLKYLRDLALS